MGWGLSNQNKQTKNKEKKKVTSENDQPQQACTSPFMQVRSTASLLRVCTGTCHAWTSALAQGEDGARTNGHSIHCIQGSREPAAAHMWGQDGPRGIELHGKGNTEEEIVTQNRKQKLRVKLGGRWKGRALQKNASPGGVLGEARRVPQTACSCLAC